MKKLILNPAFQGSLILAAIIGIASLVPVLHAVMWTSLLALAFAVGLARLVAGPTAEDRAVAFKILGILIMGFCAVLAVITGRDLYIDVAIAWALQAMVGTMVIAKFLEGKRFDE